ncbi:MAG TPA: hypothetical protein VF598_04100 [Hymenobacter sp.]|jgi:hypothetical protein
MGGSGGGGGGGGGGWQQPKIPSQQKPAQPGQEEELQQSTNSDTNVPTDTTDGIGGAVVPGNREPLDEEAGPLPEMELPDDDKRDRCNIVPFKTTLAAPDPHAIASTFVGQILDIVSRGHKIEVLNTAHETCGIVLPKSSRMIECIAKDHTFIAQVLSKGGGELQVYIRNAATF